MNELDIAACPSCGNGTVFASSRLGDLRPVPCNDDCCIKMITDWWERRGFRATVERVKYSGSYTSKYHGTGLRLREVIAPDGQVFGF